jgi:DNA topoisomerase I
MGHIQATGRDARGRKQYRYHPLWTAERDATKYHRLLAFAEALPAIRQRTERDLRKPKTSRPRVLATVVALLERTHIRIGNKEYERTNRSHGLTTMRDRHVKVRGPHLDFSFRGKSGVHQTVELDDARLAKAVRECQDLPGQTLFQYLDEDEGVKAVTSLDVNGYLKEITGGAFTAKDFRTWAGTLATARELAHAQLPASSTARNRTIVAAVDRVADELGNTRAVCRRCYVHPAVLDAYRAGLTIGRLTAYRRGAAKKLRQMERRLVALLLRMDQRKAA